MAGNKLRKNQKHMPTLQNHVLERLKKPGLKGTYIIARPDFVEPLAFPKSHGLGGSSTSQRPSGGHTVTFTEVVVVTGHGSCYLRPSS